MNWEALAQAVIDRRVELGFRTRESFAAETGLSSRLLGDLERSTRDNFDRMTISRLEHALQWPRGRAMEILRTEADVDDGSPFSLRPDAVAARAARLLGDDSPLDAKTRRMLAVAVSNVFDLVGRPTRAGEDVRDQEALATFQETIEAVNRGRLREPRGADLWPGG